MRNTSDRGRTMTWYHGYVYEESHPNKSLDDRYPARDSGKLSQQSGGIVVSVTWWREEIVTLVCSRWRARLQIPMVKKASITGNFRTNQRGSYATTWIKPSSRYLPSYTMRQRAEKKSSGFRKPGTPPTSQVEVYPQNLTRWNYGDQGSPLNRLWWCIIYPQEIWHTVIWQRHILAHIAIGDRLSRLH